MISQLETTLPYEGSDDEGPKISRNCDGQKSTQQIIIAHMLKCLPDKVLSRKEVKEF
jgi:hypothetical protein